MFKLIIILFLAVNYTIATTSYFRNYFPNSPYERVTDGIVAILFALAILVAPTRKEK